MRVQALLRKVWYPASTWRREQQVTDQEQLAPTLAHQYLMMKWTTTTAIRMASTNGDANRQASKISPSIVSRLAIAR